MPIGTPAIQRFLLVAVSLFSQNPERFSIISSQEELIFPRKMNWINGYSKGTGPKHEKHWIHLLWTSAMKGFARQGSLVQGQTKNTIVNGFCAHNVSKHAIEFLAKKLRKRGLWSQTTFKNCCLQRTLAGKSCYPAYLESVALKLCHFKVHEIFLNLDVSFNHDILLVKIIKHVVEWISLQIFLIQDRGTQELWRASEKD